MLRELVRQLRAATRGLRLGQPAVGTQRARPPLPTSDSCKCESQDGWLGLASAPALAQRWDSLSLAVRNASRHGSTARWLLTMGVGVRHSVTVGGGGHTGGYSPGRARVGASTGPTTTPVLPANPKQGADRLFWKRGGRWPPLCPQERLYDAVAGAGGAGVPGLSIRPALRLGKARVVSSVLELVRPAQCHPGRL